MPHFHRDHRFLVTIVEDVSLEFTVAAEKVDNLVAEIRGNLRCRIDPMVPLTMLIIPETGHSSLLGEDSGTAADDFGVYATSQCPC